jgi:hypothetical protein
VLSVRSAVPSAECLVRVRSAGYGVPEVRSAGVRSAAQKTGKYGVSHCAMIVKRLVKIRIPIMTISTPDAISMA